MKHEYLQESIFTFEDVMKAGLSKQGAISALRRYERKGFIVKLRRGLYARVNPITGGIFANCFEIATALHPGTVVAYHSALEYYGLGHQAYFLAHCFSETRYNEEVIKGVSYHFFKPSIEEGVIERYGSSLIRVTDLERTVVDSLDRVDLAGGYEELCNCLSLIPSLDGQKILHYLRLYGKKGLYQKAGFVLSKLGIKGLDQSFFLECERNIGRAYVDLCASGEIGERDAKWRVKTPVVNV